MVVGLDLKSIPQKLYSSLAVIAVGGRTFYGAHNSEYVSNATTDLDGLIITYHMHQVFELLRQPRVLADLLRIPTILTAHMTLVEHIQTSRYHHFDGFRFSGLCSQGMKRSVKVVALETLIALASEVKPGALRILSTKDKRAYLTSHRGAEASLLLQSCVELFPSPLDQSAHPLVSHQSSLVVLCDSDIAIEYNLASESRKVRARFGIVVDILMSSMWFFFPTLSTSGSSHGHITAFSGTSSHENTPPLLLDLVRLLTKKLIRLHEAPLPLHDMSMLWARHPRFPQWIRSQIHLWVGDILCLSIRSRDMDMFKASDAGICLSSQSWRLYWSNLPNSESQQFDSGQLQPVEHTNPPGPLPHLQSLDLESTISYASEFSSGNPFGQFSNPHSMSSYFRKVVPLYKIEIEQAHLLKTTSFGARSILPLATAEHEGSHVVLYRWFSSKTLADLRLELLKRQDLHKELPASVDLKSYSDKEPEELWGATSCILQAAMQRADDMTCAYMAHNASSSDHDNPPCAPISTAFCIT